MPAEFAIVPVPAPLLRVEGLRVSLAGGGADIVSDIGFTLRPGEILGLVGESGSGKSTIAAALLGHARHGAVITGGRVLLDDLDVLSAYPASLRDLRGACVSHVPQDPGAALNPMLRIGAHLDELLLVHGRDLTSAQRAARIAEVMGDVGLPTDAGFLRRFPHQLSGGQQQRVLLALAFVLRPRLVVLDEPTTALDVVTKVLVLETVRNLCRRHGVGALYVSHDLSVVRDLVDRLVVLYAGRVVEVAASTALFAEPRHPYTRGLLTAMPDMGVRRRLVAVPGHAVAPAARPDGCPFRARCAVGTDRCLEAPPLGEQGRGHEVACHHPVAAPLLGPAEVPVVPAAAANRAPLLSVRRATARYGGHIVLSGVDLGLYAGECTALVGASGSGKTTLARALVGLGEDIGGSLLLDGAEQSLRGGLRDDTQRRRIQYIFQNPARALNPRQTVGQILGTVARHFFGLDRRQAAARVAATLAKVALPASAAHRYPAELSGGEQQRVAIARALICEPDLLICDEITSALDVSVQAAIVELLRGLQGEGLTLLFVTHDLALVRSIADRVVVLNAGTIVEQGPAGPLLDRPQHPYTRSLIAASGRAVAS